MSARNHNGVKAVLRFAKKNGFEVARQRKHIILKRGNATVTVSGSPSDQYGPTNAMKDIQKILGEKS